MSMWSSEHSTFLQRNWQRMSDAEIGDHVGRGRSAVADRRQRLGFYRSAPRNGHSREYDERIVEMWPTKSGYAIARQLKISHTFVLNVVERLGLPKRTRGESIALGGALSGVLSRHAPRKPKGITVAQTDWALENPDHPEAGLILLMAREGVIYVNAD